MTIQIKVEGLTEMRRALGAAAAQIELGIAREVTKTAITVRADVIKAIQQGPKTGRVYRRGNITHQASAPGEAPATDRGALVSSVYFEQTTSRTATIGSRLAYSYYLEYGTVDIKPRPAWTPAVEKRRPAFNKAVAEIIRRAAR